MHRGRRKSRHHSPLAAVLRAWPAATRGRKHWSGVSSVCLSSLGLICIIIGCSGSSTLGLTGMAFHAAFEADERNMMVLIVGLPLAITGLLLGMYNARSWYGKTGIVLAVLAGVWLWSRQGHF